MPSNSYLSADGLAQTLRWLGGIGAVTAEALAWHRQRSVGSVRAELAAACRANLVSRHRPLAGYPSLYTLTRRGLRVAGQPGLEPCRVSPAGARHLIACAQAAAGLGHCHRDHEVVGERELRRREREAGTALYSARLRAGSGEQHVHRPDLVLCPKHADAGLAVAVEVELAVKAPRRLLAICRAWARCKHIAGVLYLASEQAERAVRRAVARADADAQVVVVALDALLSLWQAP